MKYTVSIKCECTDRELWELEDKIYGLEECNGVSKVTFVREND